jgi:hypothetical protein
MKKIIAVLIMLFIPLSLWAQEEDAPDENSSPEISTLGKEPTPKKKFVMKNRVFEVSLFNLDINLSNNSLTAGNFIRDSDDMKQTGKFFKDPISINLNDFAGGFTFNFGASIKPVSLNFNWKDKWGFGLDIGHINVTGNLLLSENFLSLREAEDDKFGIGAAVFADLGIPVFFHINKLKIKIRPSAFLPLVYTEPNITYNYRQVVDPVTGNSGMKFQVNYDMRIYSAFDMQELEKNGFDAVMQNNDIWNNLGFDLSLGAEFPLHDVIDIGVDVINIPLAMANLNHYIRLEGEAYFDTSKINLDGLLEGGEIPEDAYGYPEDFDIKYYNDGSTKLYRPFTMLSYAKYRPFKSPILSLIPSFGFSLNPLYAELASLEGGLNIRLDLANIFITTIGVNYNDRRWKNSVDFVLNLRAFELDFGISFQSSDFVKSFQGAGLGVNVGLKLGW